MTAKHIVPPAGGSILMETEHGLSVWRPLKSLKTSVLPADSLDEFMSLLDRYVAFGDREDFVRHYWAKAGANPEHPFRTSALAEAADLKSARRALFWSALASTAMALKFSWLIGKSLPLVQ